MAAALLSGGCVSLPSATAVPAVAPLTATPFFPQEIHQCGPAALATVLVADGVTVTPEQLAERVYLPEREGSLQVELLAATRRLGRAPYRVAPRLDSIAAELRAGRPVLVLQNLALPRWPRWHYAVVIGIDSRSVTLRSGRNAEQKMSLRSFERSWRYADRWGFVVLSSGAWPGEPDPLRWLDTFAALEQTGDHAAAARGYRQGIEHWPDDSRFWFADGNVRYQQHDLPGAAMSYRRATELQPAFNAAWNNLAQVLGEQGCGRAARTALQRARENANANLLAAVEETELGLPPGDAAHCASP